MAEEEWPLYYWKARWFKPLEKEEFIVYLMPDGDFLGFKHIMGEDALGAAISQDEANLIAERFLIQYAGWDASKWEQVEAASETRSGGRIDHSFAWKSRAFSAGESELRYNLVVQGDQVGYIDYWIKVPEAFIRQYAAERNQAGILSMVAYFFGFLGFAIAGLFGIVLIRPDGKQALWPALLAGFISLAATLNLISLSPLSYDTTQDYTLFWALTILGTIFSAFFSFAFVFYAWISAQALSKLVWPRQDRILQRGDERWLSFSRSAWRGLMFGGVQMGYMVSFYLLTSKYLGWWSPVRADYSDLFATPFPFLYAFDVGLSAALIEELFFRMVGISLFLWIFRKKLTWLAVLIPGALWAFAHSGYVTYPIYVRGVELIPVAILLGLVFLKFDLLTAIISHFTYNVMIVGVILLRSSEPYYYRSGLIVVFTLALPLLPGLIWKLKRFFSKKSPLPDSLFFSPAVDDDVPKLSALLVKADWDVLLKQINRTTLCLHAGDELIGFVTGFEDEQNFAILDGVYITPKWRRQYWGATLVNVFSESMQSAEEAEVRAILLKEEKNPVSFFYNQLWNTRAQILVAEEYPVFVPMVKKGWYTFLKSLRKKKTPEIEQEIPRDIL
ncbi:MAG: CPBP family intramembrane metalloprotease [Anaerolineae bacterium]|jgi:hypothetical protein|nr:CPBP family intramembrane metalloprotease [Anaerolineae bacterium]MBT4309349.1 CPBP family intramembrane metalloprotease [Anaerolineae bacterium]MBT4459320.1 CPBP family intramembrane metalloprotease [Anaerolineae bacterium]MBT6060574.1 CPBP family intramembrane metalloprotease [Anaerolineae bacterium]MBT6321901.1 CPBP family intramembrane metalloprotease [Anaerolineae bacterium]